MTQPPKVYSLLNLYFLKLHVFKSMFARIDKDAMLFLVTCHLLLLKI